jgi:hypothetical protein
MALALRPWQRSRSISARRGWLQQAQTRPLPARGEASGPAWRSTCICSKTARRSSPVGSAGAGSEAGRSSSGGGGAAAGSGASGGGELVAGLALRCLAWLWRVERVSPKRRAVALRPSPLARAASTSARSERWHTVQVLAAGMPHRTGRQVADRFRPTDTIPASGRQPVGYLVQARSSPTSQATTPGKSSSHGPSCGGQRTSSASRAPLVSTCRRGRWRRSRRRRRPAPPRRRRRA